MSGADKQQQPKRFPVKYDKDTGELYYEQETSTGWKKIVVKQADVKVSAEKKTTNKTHAGIKLDKNSGLEMGYSNERSSHQIISYSRKGGRVALPVTEAMFLDADCRREILGAVNKAIDGTNQSELQQITWK